MGIYWWLSPFTLLLMCIVFVRCEDEQHDAREGDVDTLQCRFALEPVAGESLTYYWIRSTVRGHDNVAIGNIPLETNYQINYAPSEGRFDLMISNVTYDRDNGRFECRVKAGGSGRTLHSQGHSLVVLTQPQQPVLNSGPQAQAQEGRQLNLTCSSIGGSPSPIIKWYRDGSTHPLEAVLVAGKTRAEPTMAILTVKPNRDDNGATFRCVVRNRAMKEGQQLEATVDLSVHLKKSLRRIRPQIRSQPKGALGPPKNLSCLKVESTFVSLKWEEGFNGGLSSTKHFVLYRGVRLTDEKLCSQQRPEELEWREYDCRRANPCNVTRLEQHCSYYFKVKAVNTKGQSNSSNEISVTTKMNKILPPEQVSYHPRTRVVNFSVGPACLSLVGVIEVWTSSDEWKVLRPVTLRLSGTSSMLQEKNLRPPFRGHGRTGSPYDEFYSRLRLKLCLQNNQHICSNYVEADTGESHVKKDVTKTTVKFILMIVTCLIFVICPILLLICCRRERIENQTDSSRNEMATPPPQSPPYYAATGRENNSLENSMDIPLSMNDSKSVEYATQPYDSDNGATYTVTAVLHSPPRNVIAESDNIKLSQDSLCQMKMAAANNFPGMSPHQMIDRQSNYGKSLRSSQNPSRHDSDPYASVHKPKKRMDQHMDSPYHEVSGLPDTYAEAGGEDKPALSLSYDESLESGYSTPNSRARRLITEIFV